MPSHTSSRGVSETPATPVHRRLADINGYGLPESAGEQEPATRTILNQYAADRSAIEVDSTPAYTDQLPVKLSSQTMLGSPTFPHLSGPYKTFMTRFR